MWDEITYPFPNLSGCTTEAPIEEFNKNQDILPQNRPPGFLLLFMWFNEGLEFLQWKRLPGHCLNIKTVFPGMGISIIKIWWS